ncbi:hypothetical protein NDU88_002836 [Pleurodeles waltl]|uniref:Uncharacterized protein n=1 Tax=Pleurodeles waltl TaxID=8319 RepID=A0AAV7UZY8_PLEWA|nr:hypothetical protein NDU88_002836 [Pleurodeles waltl]
MLTFATLLAISYPSDTAGWLLAARYPTCVLDVSKTQEKRALTNTKASERRRAKHPDLQVGEAVILKDRHLGWKFPTPFEPDVWRVEKVGRTMSTAMREGRKCGGGMAESSRWVVPHIHARRMKVHEATAVGYNRDLEGASSP